MKKILKSLKSGYGLDYIEPFYINGERISSMSLWEAFCDMEVTYVKNKPIVDKIRSGDFKLLKVLAGLMLRGGDRLIHPEHIDYYFGWRFNIDD